MPLSSFISDLYSSFTVSDVHAEAPPAAEPEAEEPAKDEKKEEPAAVAAAEEEEEEEEPEDPFPSLLQECEKTSKCVPTKHHYSECVERVTAAEESDSKGPKEDCVEEFFHLMHCTTQRAAPKLFAKLK